MDVRQIGVEQFQQVIQGLQNADNSVRKQAESVYFQFKEQESSKCVQFLVQTLRQSQGVGDRSMCALLLRKALNKDLQTSLPKELLDAVKQELLKSLTEEQNKQVRHKICDTVSDIASVGDINWPELLPFLFSCINGSNESAIQSGYFCLAELSGVYLDQIKQHLDPILMCYKKCYSERSLETKCQATNSMINILLQFDNEDKELNKWQSLNQPFIQVLMQSVQEGESAITHSQNILERLIELSDYNPGFLKPNIQELCEILLQIAKADQVDEQLKILAVECLLSLYEARNKSPGIMKKAPNVLKELFMVLMTFLLQIEDDPDWYKAEDDNDQSGEQESYQAGQEGLDRLAIAVTGKQLLPIMGPLLKQWIQSPKWQNRNAALICVTQVAEGCQKTIKQYSSEIIDLALLGSRDPQPQVRWAASQALGQLCTDLQPDIQNQFHHVILPALLMLLQDYENSRVQAHAAAALVNFCEGCSKQILLQYSDQVVQKLLIVLQKGSKISVQVGLTAMAQVAETMQSDFSKVFDAVIPILVHYLYLNDPNMNTARARALECASIVGLSVGIDQFKPYAHQIMEVLQQLEQQKLPDDDPLNQFKLSAGFRLCKILDKDFVPYLPVVMPVLLHSAKVQPISVETQDPIDQVNKTEEEEEEGVQSILLNDKEVRIKTSLSEEKALAISLLANYAEQMKEDFLPYIQEVTDIMIKGLKALYNEEIRINSIEGLPLIIKCVLAAKENGKFNDNSLLQNMVVYIFNELVSTLDQEEDLEIQATCAESVETVMEDIEPVMLTKEQIEKTFTVFRSIWDQSEISKTERLKYFKDLDEDEQEVADDELDQIREVQDRLSACMGVFLKKYQDKVFSFVEPFLLDVQKLLASDNFEDKRIALFFIDDLVEYTPGQAINYAPQIYKVLYDNTTSTDADVRHSAIFGLTLVLERMPAFIQANTSYVGQATEMALRILDIPDARNEDNNLGFENALSLLSKVIQLYPQYVDNTAYLTQRLLQEMPLNQDLTEARRVHCIIADMVLKGEHGGLLDKNPKYAQRILEIGIQILGSEDELVTEQDKEKYIRIVSTLADKLGQQELQQAMGKLTPEEQQKLQTVMQSLG